MKQERDGSDARLAEARRRALRAARAVTLTALVAGGLGGCADAVAPALEGDGPVLVADASTDVPTDAPADGPADGPVDAGACFGEGAVTAFGGWQAFFEACCLDREDPVPLACTPWGPFMPPAMEA